MISPRTAATGILVAAALLAAPPSPAQTTPPARPAAPADSAASDSLVVRLEPGARDPVWAVLLGLAFSDAHGTLTGERLADEVRKSGRTSQLPYDMMEDTRREAAQRPRESIVTTRFKAAIDLPVPYQILSYHPGSFRGTDLLVFREIDLGTVTIAHQVLVNRKVTMAPFDIHDVHLFILKKGALEIDIDGWLDALAGDNLDDTWVAGIAVFRRGNGVYGMALGYNDKGEGRSGTLSFGEDKVLYPNPPDLKSAARQLRRTLEYYEPGVAARRRASR